MHRREAAAVLDELASKGIYAIVFKGLAFANTIYRDPQDRPHSDIDLLVSEAQFEDAISVLEARGYVAALETTDAAVKGQRDLRKPGPVSVALDVHSRLFNPRLFATVDGFAELFARARPVPALGRHGRTLSNVDALLHAAVHRVAHHYRSQSPQWLKDIDLLARVLSPVEWRWLADRARAWRVAALVVDGLHAAHDMYGTPVDALADWVVPSDEPSRTLLHGEPTELKIQALSVWHAPDWAARWRIVRAHVLPDADYMLRSYATHSRWRLPELYARRLVGGVVRGAWRRTGA